MKSIAFIDTEIEQKSNRILDIGCIKDNGDRFHSNSIADFKRYINGSQFICGHNIIHHDLKYLHQSISEAGAFTPMYIDTLFLSPLLFPQEPYHALLKDDKLQSDELNNPLNDSMKARDLFFDEVSAFQLLNQPMQDILYSLLHDQKEFISFFTYLGFRTDTTNAENQIRGYFNAQICENANLNKLINEYPVALAYCLALINVNDRYSITPPWVLRKFREVERIMYLLTNKPCIPGCEYCDMAFDIHVGLKRYFGFDSYRTFSGEPLQAKAVQAAVDSKSILAIFPTGGGKSLTFQIPALMSGLNSKGLTVVISPLQSLMKDQVDNLEKSGITEAVTINGLLDPIERAKSFERVENGSATLLYISPESLRSKTILRLMLGRNIVRFVVDEAHCFSAWGQDFRVDYMYIGEFISMIQELKNLEEKIPVSCFTATAKQKVIEDIRNYFKETLSLELEVFSTKTTRTNLQYGVLKKTDEEEKYNTVRELIEEKECPTIIYVSRTNKAYQLAERLEKDGYSAKPYHGKMDKNEKSANQDAFIEGNVQIIVATSAFGMGVDKKDVGLVIHYEISDSLENYVQEAGRAGRDQSITADCYVLFNEEDLGKHFILLNQTKLSIKEIQQVWRAIKFITNFRSTVSNSALEIARKAGWDDNISEIETRVTTAIAALEEAGYLKRGQNAPRIFANSILSRNAMEAIEKINASNKFTEDQKINAVRIIKKLLSSKSRRQSEEEVAESRVDYISDHLGIVKEEVIKIIYLLREEKILADSKDLTAFIRRGTNKNRPIKTVESFGKIENFLFPLIQESENSFHIKELNEQAEMAGCENTTPSKLKTIFNFWKIKNWIKLGAEDYSNNHVRIVFTQPKNTIKNKLEKRHELVSFIIKYLFDKSEEKIVDQELNNEQVRIEFSVNELKDAYEKHNLLIRSEIDLDDLEDALFYLSRIDAIKIEGGFLVVYNRLTIERLEKNNKINYKKDDYIKLSKFYENKTQQIHIVGEYAKKMIDDYQEALQFVEDYFHLNYSSFLNKYFNVTRQEEMKRSLTPAMFKKLFGELSTAQLNIIKDSQNQYIVVAAGPGSGKTKILVHKLASLLLMEDVKHEQLLMVTFSRAAATEFKKRLIDLIGNAANFVTIKTFHSYCFDLLGRVGSIEKSGVIIKLAIEKILSNEIEPNRITKTVLVIDEAQDMDADEFELVKTLMEKNEDMRVIAVGDDDQNIYEFRGSNSKYFESFITVQQARKYELSENFRSKNNLVEFTNQFVRTIHHRMKSEHILSKHKKNGAIIIHQYQSENLIVPIVNNILKTDLSGSTCVLTKTNDEAIQITGLLLNHGIPAKLIQTNDNFSLYNLDEVRFFLDQLKLTEDVYTINDEVWQSAKRNFWNEYRNSTKAGILVQLIKNFEATNPKRKYKSDLEVFIKESRMEDFIEGSIETIFVSTMHKAKGKEFDNVFLLLDNYQLHSDETKRLLYVAMTRGKKNLFIHTNENYFGKFDVENLTIIHDETFYFPPDQLVMHLTHRDVQLGFFMDRQQLITQLRSGDTLDVNSNVWLDRNGKPVLKFSRHFKEQIEQMKENGYVMTIAEVNFVLNWYNEELEKEFKIVLPVVWFSKSDDRSAT